MWAPRRRRRYGRGYRRGRSAAAGSVARARRPLHRYGRIAAVVADDGRPSPSDVHRDEVHAQRQAPAAAAPSGSVAPLEQRADRAPQRGPLAVVERSPRRGRSRAGPGAAPRPRRAPAAAPGRRHEVELVAADPHVAREDRPARRLEPARDQRLAASPIRCAAVLVDRCIQGHPPRRWTAALTPACGARRGASLGARRPRGGGTRRAPARSRGPGRCRPWCLRSEAANSSCSATNASHCVHRVERHRDHDPGPAVGHELRDLLDVVVLEAASRGPPRSPRRSPRRPATAPSADRARQRREERSPRRRRTGRRGPRPGPCALSFVIVSLPPGALWTSAQSSTVIALSPGSRPRSRRARLGDDLLAAKPRKYEPGALRLAHRRRSSRGAVPVGSAVSCPQSMCGLSRCAASASSVRRSASSRSGSVHRPRSRRRGCRSPSVRARRTATAGRRRAGPGSPATTRGGAASSPCARIASRCSFVA